LLALTIVAALIAPSSAANAAPTPPAAAAAASQTYAPADQSGGTNFVQNCPDAPSGHFRCFSVIRSDGGGAHAHTPTPQGYGPAEYRGAYGLNGLVSPNNAVVAIVDAYDNPNAKADLDMYSTIYGIPVLPNCTGAIASSAVPCFQKVDQNGGTTFPIYNESWAGEIALDVQAVHAICPNCRILLIEATTNSYADMMAAVDRARILGAHVVSNSYGGGESSGLYTSYDSVFNNTGIGYTVSSGDDGFDAGAQFPAGSRYVTAVGGTSLTVGTGNTYGSETVWNWHTGHGLAGSGCSAVEPKPTFQTDAGCTNRMIADISADASNASVYWTKQGQAGTWFVFGGTSLSAPMIAAMYGLAGGVPDGQYGNAWLYSHMTAGNLHDVTTGDNILNTATVNCNSQPYFCHGVSGYDGPTGRGTPLGLSAFQPALPPKVTMTGPTGTQGNHPTFTWIALTPAPTDYFLADLSVATNSFENGGLLQLLHNPDPTCTTTCSWTLPGGSPPLTQGSHIAFLIAKNSTGWGSAWSDPIQYCVTTCTPQKPGKPTLTGPDGFGIQNQPTFTWNQMSSVDAYYVYDYVWRTETWDVQQAVNATCTGGTCSWTPGSALPAGKHTYYLIAQNSVGFGDWSDPDTYWVDGPGANFNNQFTSLAESPYWDAVVGSWFVGNGFIYTSGAVNQFASLVHEDSYTTLDYSVRVFRYSSSYSFGVLIRGNVLPLNNENRWNKSYLFGMWRNTQWGVWRDNGTVETNLAFHGAGDTRFNANDAWNVLRVTANGSTLTFYANGVQVASVTDATFSAGNVGIYAVNNDGNFFADYATLSTTIANTSPAAGAESAPPSSSAKPTDKADGPMPAANPSAASGAPSAPGSGAGAVPALPTK